MFLRQGFKASMTQTLPYFAYSLNTWSCRSGLRSFCGCFDDCTITFQVYTHILDDVCQIYNKMQQVTASVIYYSSLPETSDPTPDI